MEKIKVFHGPIPEGAKLVHMFYPYTNVLHPRGTMKKESVGEYILEKLESNFELFTDEKYCDNPSVTDLLEKMHENLIEEVANAWTTFVQICMEKKGLSLKTKIQLYIICLCISKPTMDKELLKEFSDIVTQNYTVFEYYMNFVDELSKSKNLSNFYYISRFHINLISTVNYQDIRYVNRLEEYRSKETNRRVKQ